MTVSRKVVTKYVQKREITNVKTVRLLSIVTILCLWEGVVRIFQIPPYALPTFSSVIIEIGRQIISGELFVHLFYTVIRSVIGILIGGFVGVALGLIMGWYRWCEQIFGYIISATYPLPKIALIPILMMWLGLGELPRLVMAFAGVVYPVLINTMVGVKSIDPVLVKAARDMGANDRQLFWEVMLPGSMPMVFAGLKLGSGVAFILVVASEMLYGQLGVGYQVQDAASILYMHRVVAGLLVLCVLGVLLFFSVDLLERWVIPWHVKKS